MQFFLFTIMILIFLEKNQSYQIPCKLYKKNIQRSIWWNSKQQWKKKYKRNIKSNLFDPKKATRSSKWFQTRNCTGSSSNLTFYHCNTNLYGFGGIDWTFSVLDSIKWFWTLLKLLDSDRSDLRSFVYDLLCEYYRWWWWWMNAI